MAKYGIVERKYRKKLKAVFEKYVRIAKKLLRINMDFKTTYIAHYTYKGDETNVGYALLMVKFKKGEFDYKVKLNFELKKLYIDHIYCENYIAHIVFHELCHIKHYEILKKLKKRYSFFSYKGGHFSGFYRTLKYLYCKYREIFDNDIF